MEGITSILADPETLKGSLRSSFRVYHTSPEADVLLLDAPDQVEVSETRQNLVAELHNRRTKLFARANSPGEVKTLLGVLERGVDGVLLKASRLEEVRE